MTMMKQNASARKSRDHVAFVAATPASPPSSDEATQASRLQTTAPREKYNAHERNQAHWLRYERAQWLRRHDLPEIARQQVEVQGVDFAVEVGVAIPPIFPGLIEVLGEASEIGGIDLAVEIGVASEGVAKKEARCVNGLVHERADVEGTGVEVTDGGLVDIERIRGDCRGVRRRDAGAGPSAVVITGQKLGLERRQRTATGVIDDETAGPT